MLNNLARLSNENHEKRKLALKTILDECGLPYLCQNKSVSDRHIENIIVRFGVSEKRFVIGAHYDSVEGSTGANDNAAGVCILIELARTLSGVSHVPELDIVFFDHEETGGLGSTLYLNLIGKKNIAAMINFDICGVGSQILAAPAKNTVVGPLKKALAKIDFKKHNLEIVDKLPTGDERVFEENGIPNISVCILPTQDVEPMKELFQKSDDVAPEDFPSIIETMHNGPRDSVETVELSAMKRIYEFAKSLVFQL